MPRLSSVATHPLLSDRAAALEPEEITAQQVVAESLLKIDTLTVVDQKDCDKVDAAVTMQVNFQVETGLEGHMLQEARRGARHVVYRGRNRMTHIHRSALAVIHEVKNRLKAW